MILYVVCRDETDYNGERSYPEAFRTLPEADTYITACKAQDLADPQRVKQGWLPRYSAEPTLLR